MTPSSEVIKPLQRHKNSRRTRLSLRNPTGSIRLPKPISNDDNNIEGLMLSFPQAHGTGTLFTSNHRFTSITQPIIGAGARKKDQSESIGDARRSSYSGSPSLVGPIHRIEKRQHESTDSGIDLSSSTNSSVQHYQQPQSPTIHRPLSTLNEDVNAYEGSSHTHSIRGSDGHLEHHRSAGKGIRHHLHDGHRRASLSIQEQGQINHPTHGATFKVNKNEHPYSPIQHYRLSHDLTREILPTMQSVVRKHNPSASKPLKKTTRLNTIVQPPIPPSRPLTRVTSRSHHEPVNQVVKPKATTPMGHYSHPEQVKAPIHRPVIDMQHAPLPPRRVLQQIIPLDSPPSNTHSLSPKQPNPSKAVFHPTTSVRRDGLGASPSQNVHVTPARDTKQTLPAFHHNESNNDLPEKRRWNSINNDQKYPPKDPTPTTTKYTPEPVRIPHQTKPIDEHDRLRVSTPRSYYILTKDDKNNQHRVIATDQRQTSNDFNRRHPSQIESKPAGHDSRNKNRTSNEVESGHHRRTLATPLHLRPIQPISTRADRNQRFNQQEKSLDPAMHNLLRTTRIQPPNITNTQVKQQSTRSNHSSKINPIETSQKAQQSNGSSQTRSSTVVLDYQINLDKCHSSKPASSSSCRKSTDHQTNLTYRLGSTDGQQPLPSNPIPPIDNNSQPPQTSSPQTLPFSGAGEADTTAQGATTASSSRQSTALKAIEHRYSASSSNDYSFLLERPPLSLGKATLSPGEEADISTNDDTDDGWSDDSIEIIYIDERYLTQKKKTAASSSSSSSHFIFQPHARLRTQQQDILLQ